MRGDAVSPDDTDRMHAVDPMASTIPAPPPNFDPDSTIPAPPPSFDVPLHEDWLEDA